MLKWLGKGAQRSKPEDISIEPIFDADPPLFVLYPQAKLPGSTAPKTTRISGKFLIILKTPEHLLAVFAQLTSACLLRTPDASDDDSQPPLLCDVKLSPGLFPPGEYELPFYFDVPCDYWGRSAIIDPDDREDERVYGLWYRLDLHITRRLGANQTDVVMAQFPTKRYFKRMMSDSESWRKLYTNRFFTLVPSPVGPGETVPWLERAIEEFAPQLGPINLVLTSRSLTVGALVNFQITLPAIPAESKLLRIIGSLHAQYGWTSLRSDGPRWDDKPNTFALFELSSSSFELDSVSGALSAATVARLPNDRTIGPTTPKLTRSPLRIRYNLGVAFEAQDSSGRRTLVSIKEPVELASCFLISEYVNLPMYGSSPLPKEEFNPERKDERCVCACGFTIDQLLDRENEGIEDVAEYQPPEIKPPEARARASSPVT